MASLASLEIGSKLIIGGKMLEVKDFSASLYVYKDSKIGGPMERVETNIAHYFLVDVKGKWWVLDYPSSGDKSLIGFYRWGMAKGKRGKRIPLGAIKVPDKTDG